MLIILPSVLQPRKARCGTLQILYQADRIFFNIPIEICRVREYLFYEQTPFARTVHTPHIEIPAYRLCGFMGCFAQLQIYALPSEWYSLRSDPLLRRHSTRKRHLCPPFRYPRRTGHKNKAFRLLNAQKQTASNRSRMLSACGPLPFTAADFVISSNYRLSAHGKVPFYLMRFSLCKAPPS